MIVLKTTTRVKCHVGKADVLFGRRFCHKYQTLVYSLPPPVLIPTIKYSGVLILHAAIVDVALILLISIAQEIKFVEVTLRSSL